MAMMELAHKMAEATSHTFSYGVAYQVNDYTADGTVFDYMAGVRKVYFIFLFLRYQIYYYSFFFISKYLIYIYCTYQTP